jgi:hypothetical protein
MGETLSLFWMHDHEEFVLRYPARSHRWGGFIKDSDDSCAFVVLEEKCLVFELGRGCQHPASSGKHTPSQSAVDDYGPVFQTAILLNDLIDLPSGLKLSKQKTPGGTRRWKVSREIRGICFPMGDQGTLQVIQVLPDSKLLAKFIPNNPIKAAFKDLIARVVDKGSELHHTELVSEVLDGDLPSIGVFIVS